MPYPAWIIVEADTPRCTRCGASWDRSIAADADAAVPGDEACAWGAVLTGMVAFAEHHRWCGGGEESVAVLSGMVEAVLDRHGEPADSDASPAPAARPGWPAPEPSPGRCPKCGTPYRNPRYRRCSVCKPTGLGRCPKCGKDYKSVRRCFECTPTPVMLQHRARANGSH